MFTAKEYSKCIGNAVLQSQSEQSSRDDDQNIDYPGYITIPDEASGANAVLIQVYVNPEELLALGLTIDDIAGVPLVTINESDKDNASISGEVLSINSVAVGGYSTPGQKLLNYGNYLVETGHNISKAMIIPFNRNINVYIALTYFK